MTNIRITIIVIVFNGSEFAKKIVNPKLICETQSEFIVKSKYIRDMQSEFRVNSRDTQ